MRFPLALALVATLLVAPAARAGWRGEGPFSANVTDLAFAPKAPGTVYAATSGGGVWRSDDGGRNWVLPGGGMTSRTVAWVLPDPGDANRVWAGVKGGNPGLWRSTDRGATWKPVQEGYAGALGRMHSLDQPICFVGAKTILVPATNLHYRSDDGGKSWKDFRVDGQDAYVFAADPRDPKVVLAGGRGQALHLSRSVDGGKSWKATGQGLGTISIRQLFFDAADSRKVWATGGTFASVFRSLDGGDNWTKVPLPVGGTSDLFDFVQDPADPARLWAATEDGLLASGDGGDSWGEVEGDFGRYLVTAVAFDPAKKTNLLVGAGGSGIFRSEDGGSGWAASGAGMAAGWPKRIWGVAGGDALFVQMATGLFERDPDGSWLELERPFSSGKSASLEGILFDRGNPGRGWAFNGSRLWTWDGRRFQEVEKEEPSLRDMMKGKMASAQFQSLAQDPGNPKVLYAGSWSNDEPGTAVWKSVDGGKKWKPSGTDLPADRIDLLRAAAPGRVFAVVERKTLFRTVDGGAKWTPAGTGLPDAAIHDVAVDPTTPERAFCATEKGLFRSTDGGGSWVRVAGGWKGDEVEAVVVDPAKGGVYAGTFSGVWRSTDGGTTWAAMNEGLLNLDIRALAIAGKTPRLWAGVAGGSVVSIELP